MSIVNESLNNSCIIQIISFYIVDMRDLTAGSIT